MRREGKEHAKDGDTSRLIFMARQSLLGNQSAAEPCIASLVPLSVTSISWVALAVIIGQSGHMRVKTAFPLTILCLNLAACAATRVEHAAATAAPPGTGAAPDAQQARPGPAGPQQIALDSGAAPVAKAPSERPTAPTLMVRTGATITPVDDSLAEPRSCGAAVRTAERSHGLPEGLLSAIARTESNFQPTALRIAGRSLYPATSDEARRIARQALDRSSSVMAGCMQVNVGVHDPDGELWALDPKEAADWAANYLQDLHDRWGSWDAAVQSYGGSRGPAGRAYLRRVNSHMPDGTDTDEEVAAAP